MPPTSNRHDIPHWTHVDANKPQHKGGVCVSDDYGARWKVLNNTLPELPCTGIVVDPKSKPDKLTMYATFFEGGVYKTTDGGKTWEKKVRGLGQQGQPPQLQGQDPSQDRRPLLRDRRDARGRQQLPRSRRHLEVH